MEKTTKQKRIEKLKDQILSILQPWEWKKMDDIKIDLQLSTKTPAQYDFFTRALDELFVSGKIEVLGNEIRINQ